MKFSNFKLLFLLIPAVAGSCSSNTGNGDRITPADVVLNPNTADGKGELSDLPVIEFEETVHDFGEIIEGETVSFEFLFTNTGKSDLVIAEVSTGCGCAVASFARNPVPPGKKGTVKVSFNSVGRRRFQTKNIIVVANTQPNVTQLRIKAQVLVPGGE
jgi:hypothetical protein